MDRLLMNQGHQDWTSGNPPGFVFTQERNRGPTIVSLGHNFREPLRKIYVPGNTPAFPERSETASIFKESQSATLVHNTRSLSSQFQKTGSNLAELPLKTRFQKDQQTSSVEKFLGSVSQLPRALEGVKKNQSTSVSKESKNLKNSQIVVTNLNSVQKPRKFKLMIPPKPQNLTCLDQVSHSSAQEQVRTKQKTRDFPYVVETPAKKNKITAVNHMNKEEKQSNSVKPMSALIEPMSSEYFTQNTGLCPILGESKSSSEPSIKNPLSQYFLASLDTASVSGEKRKALELSSSKMQNRTISWSTESQFNPAQTMSASIEPMSSEYFTQKTGLHPILGELNSSSSESNTNPSQHFQASQDTVSVSGEQLQAYELSSSKRQKSRTFSWLTESQSNPVKTVSASIQPVTSDHPKQQTGLCLILEKQKSSSPEFAIKNTFSEDYKSLQSTKIEKDVDRLRERLKLFDELICVKCWTKFTSQDELLKHEPIHFDD